METLSFTFYQNNVVQKITAQDLFRNKRILICSVVRPWMNIPDQYADYVVSVREQYLSSGIDEIYFINSADGMFVVAKFDLVHPEIIMLHDDNNGFVSFLRDQQNKTNFTVDELSKYWTYQALLNNGKVEHFNDEPLDNYVKCLIKAGKKLYLDTHKFVVTEGERIALQRATLMPCEQDRNKTPNGHLFYFNVWPNTKLETYLGIDNAKNT